MFDAVEHLGVGRIDRRVVGARSPEIEDVATCWGCLSVQSVRVPRGSPAVRPRF